MTETTQKDAIALLEPYFTEKAPFQLPNNIKEVLVRFAPWVAVLLFLISLPAVLFVLGVGSVLTPFMMVPGYTGFGMAVVFLIAQMVLLALAIPGLFKRSRSAWNLMFYAEAVSAVIGFYFLFQVRAKYTN